MLLDWMVRELRLEPSYITHLASRASHLYKTFSIPKASGERRVIHNPTRELKAIHRWLLRRVISSLPVHEAAAAYRKGKGVLNHALVHAGGRYLLRLDLRHFFPSLTSDDVSAHIRQYAKRIHVDWTIDDTELLCKLVCRWGRLTIGAPTSPALSNTLCHPLDKGLSELAASLEAKYTRYADDLYFSSMIRGTLEKVPTQVSAILEGLAYPVHLRLNYQKTRHSSRGHRQMITGLVLTNEGTVSVGRARKRLLRSYLHRYDELDPAERLKVAGLLAHYRSVEPGLIDRKVSPGPVVT